MATITLEYDQQKKGVTELLDSLLKMGIFKVKNIEDDPEYNPEFVKMIKDSHKEESILTLSSKEEIREFLAI